MIQNQSTTINRLPCLLIALKTSKFSPSKLDKNESEMLAQQKGADREYIKVRKNLINPKYLEVINSHIKEGNDLLESLSFLWNKGFRVISNINLDKFRLKFEDILDRFNNAVETFLGNYEDIVKRSRVELGTFFDESDYPSVDTLREKFSMELVVLPMPEDLKDFRTHVAPETEAFISARKEEEMNELLEAGFEQTCNRIKEFVERLQVAMADDKRVYDTHFSNILMVADALEGLNVTNDPRLSDLITPLRKLGGISAESVRKDKGLRPALAQEAQDILDTMSDWA